MIQIRCRSCNETLRAQETDAGRAGRCPHCGTAYRVPARRETPPSLARDATAARTGRARIGVVESFILAVGMVTSAVLALLCAAGWVFGITRAFTDFEGFAIAAVSFFGFCLSAALFIVFRRVRRL